MIFIISPLNQNQNQNTWFSIRFTKADYFPLTLRVHVKSAIIDFNQNIRLNDTGQLKS